MRLRSLVIGILSVLGAATGAHAQGCILCYTTAAGAGAAAQRSLDFGILTLLAPALTMFLFVMFLLYRRAVSASV
jgi:hypothetical protein